MVEQARSNEETAEYARATLEAGRLLARDIFRLTQEIAPEVRAGAGIYLACIALLTNKGKDVDDKEVKETLDLLLELVFDQVVDMLAAQRKGRH